MPKQSTKTAKKETKSNTTPKKATEPTTQQDKPKKKTGTPSQY